MILFSQHMLYKKCQPKLTLFSPRFHFKRFLLCCLSLYTPNSSVETCSNLLYACPAMPSHTFSLTANAPSSPPDRSPLLVHFLHSPIFPPFEFLSHFPWPHFPTFPTSPTPTLMHSNSVLLQTFSPLNTAANINPRALPLWCSPSHTHLFSTPTLPLPTHLLSTPTLPFPALHSAVPHSHSAVPHPTLSCSPLPLSLSCFPLPLSRSPLQLSYSSLSLSCSILPLCRSSPMHTVLFRTLTELFATRTLPLPTPTQLYPSLTQRFPTSIHMLPTLKYLAVPHSNIIHSLLPNYSSCNIIWSPSLSDKPTSVFPNST